MAAMAQEQARLDRVVFIPCAVPPHKKIRRLASADDRLAMVRLSVAGNPCFSVSDIEIKRGGKSYTADTVAWFSRRYPEASLFFLIGADNFCSLPQWRRWEWLKEQLTFIVAPRPDVSMTQPAFDCRYLILQMPHIGLASREIRHRLRLGQSIRYMVPESVRRYIENHGVYASKNCTTGGGFHNTDRRSS